MAKEDAILRAQGLSKTNIINVLAAAMPHRTREAIKSPPWRKDEFLLERIGPSCYGVKICCTMNDQYMNDLYMVSW